MTKSQPLVLPRGDRFFTRDRGFYRQWFRLFLLLLMQNIITYSVNVADNIMLGAYSQSALSGAAAVNQLQYILQQVMNSGLGEGLVVLGAQLWGQRDTDRLQSVAGMALICGWGLGLLLTLMAIVSPEGMVGLFTSDAAIVAEGAAYLRIMRWSYLIFITTAILLCLLRSVQIAGIAFRLSILSLLINVGINRVLIFGALGFPEMGIRGAAIGTLTARIVELAALLVWCLRGGRLPFRPEIKKLFARNRALFRQYIRVALPCVVSSVLFAGSVAMQTVIMGHLSSDAIASGSASGTLFQCCKMIPIGAAAATGVMIGKTIGSGRLDDLRACVRTLQVIFIGIGLIFGALLWLISKPILSMYTLSPQAALYAGQMIAVMALTSVCTGYQMPCLIGVIRGGGDTQFVMRCDMIFGWLIVVPLSLCAAFLWRWPVPVITLCLNIDQVIKVPLVTWKIHTLTWIKRLTK